MNNYKRVLEELKQVDNVTQVIQVSKEDQLLQEEKVIVKTSLQIKASRLRYLEYLGEEQTSWPSVKNTEAKLKECRQERTEVKSQLEKAKDQLYSILQNLIEEQTLSEGKIIKLEEKLSTFEEKRRSFQSLHKLDPDSADAAISRCEQAVNKIKGELLEQRQQVADRDQNIRDIKLQLSKLGTSRNTAKKNERLHQTVEFINHLSGVNVQVTGPLEIQIEFLPCKDGNALIPDQDGLNLAMTLTFKEDFQGQVKLADVKINVDHFNLSNIIETAITNNDVPYLVLSTQERWVSHFPLLSEIDFLNQNHAIDWIQEKSRLRVLVGKCGKTMFTLSVPKDYPLSREVILLDSYGVDNVDMDDLPGKDSTLSEWVQYLEDKYGNL